MRNLQAKSEVSEHRVKVLEVITPGRIAGAERSTLSLCLGLTKRGHRVVTACTRGHPLVAFMRQRGAEVWPLSVAGKGNLLAPYWIARAARRMNADLINTQLSSASLWGTLAGRLVGIPTVATVRALCQKWCYLFADRIIAVSEGVKDHLASQGLPRRRMAVVYNGIDVERFAAAPAAPEAKRALGFDTEDLVIGVAAHLTKRKGHRFLLESSARLTKEFPRLRLLFVGEGPERDGLRQLSRGLGMESRVVFAGYHDEIIPFMAAMDIVVLPAVGIEGFGRVLVEAGAMARPVVTTRVGGTAEIVQEGITGFVVEPWDCESMGDRLRALLRSQELRRSIGEAARDRVASHFTTDLMVENTERVFENVCASFTDRFPRAVRHPV